MFWCDELVKDLQGPQVINDSKTPSGRAHVGALRGPLIHDAIFRTLKSRGIPVRYLFGVDDYDPVDEIPYGQTEHFEKYLGAPLCNTPAPAGSKATDMADHFIGESFSVFDELGIRPEFYRMRDIYRSGKFNEAIDAILKKADAVRRIYKEVSGSVRPENWHPFQTICENCGRIGTTEVTAYDGKEVTYECKPNLVKWAKGCGHKGKVSPFDGKGKLPWKLEWCAKWKTFPVTIEGAGMDHSTKGGSRDVAMACLKEIFGQQPPLNCKYDFFLVGGAKMSSSKGVGVTARDMANFLPPELVRFLLIRPFPKQTVNFEPSEEYTIKLFNEYDRFLDKYYHDPKVFIDDKRIYELSEVTPEPDHWVPDFQLLSALMQMPHVDVLKELQLRKGSPFTEIELKHLQLRMRAVKYWLDHFATEDEKTKLQDSLPARAEELTQTQRAFLHILAEALPTATWESNALQVVVFNSARLTPIDQPSAFKAIYRVLLDRTNGPKAGNLLSFLERDFVTKRFKEVQVDNAKFYQESAATLEDLKAWLAKEKANIAEISATQTSVGGQTFVELLATFADKKAHRRRVSVSGDVKAWVDALSQEAGMPISLK